MQRAQAGGRNCPKAGYLFAARSERMQGTAGDMRAGDHWCATARISSTGFGQRTCQRVARASRKSAHRRAILAIMPRFMPMSVESAPE